MSLITRDYHRWASTVLGAARVSVGLSVSGSVSLSVCLSVSDYGPVSTRIIVRLLDVYAMHCTITCDVICKQSASIFKDKVM